MRAVTLIPNFHKHLVLETVQRMNLNVMQVVLQEELMIANFAFTHKERLAEQVETTNLVPFGRSAKVIEV